MKLAVLIMTMAFGLSAFAASAGDGHHAEGIPKVVIWQAINVAIIFGFVYWKFGGKIVDLFKSRNAVFVNESQKSKMIQLEAEKKLNEIKHKISLLESTSQESVERARAEAAEMRNQMIQDSKQLAERIKREAETVAQVEIQSAKRALHEEVVKESVKQAKEILKKDVGQTDQQRLQDNFATQIDSVRLGAKA